MEKMFKQSYEISLWDDRLTAVYEDGTESQNFIDSTKSIVAQYYKEVKICVIGSDNMSSPFRVVEPSLTRKTDGTNSLNFSIYTKIYNEETEEFDENPFLKYLTNERKIKLKFFPRGEMVWLDFIIKKVEQSSENFKATYTATDLFINELSKTGYHLEFDQELENGQGTIQELAERILDQTEWRVGDDSEIIQQTNKEVVYSVELEEDLIAHDIFEEKEISIPKGNIIYAFYSSFQDIDPNCFQFVYNENNVYFKDQNNILYDVGNYYCNKEDVIGEKNLCNDFRAEKYIRSQKSGYDKILKKYVNVYEKDSQQYYGYIDTQYFSPSLVSNYIANGANIINSSGWNQEKDGTIKTDMEPPASVQLKEGQSRVFGLVYEQSESDDNRNRFLINSGFRSNAELIKEISKNQKFVFGIKGTSLTDNQKYRCRIGRFNKEAGELEDLLFSTAGCEPIVMNESVGSLYYFTNLSPNFTVSYEELTNIDQTQFAILIDVVDANDSIINGKFFITQVEFFQQFEGKTQVTEDQQPEEGIILPSGKILSLDGKISEEIAASQIINTYYYYNKDQEIQKPEEIKYEYIGEQNSSFLPVYDYNFEKIRSISKKETNRFDLLQTLSETFECWCRFDVWHDTDGKILLAKDLALLIDGGNAYSVEKLIFLGGTSYSLSDEFVLSANDRTKVDNPYTQLKFVTFHKRIGQKTNIGFKYGINLKSVSRTLESNDIATKLIVKSNTNQFADNGSCNIALANDNPSGENFVYDFSYYINQNLLNQENLNNDLYYFEDEETEISRKWIGLYVRLKAINKRRDALIVEQVGLTKQYAKHKSTYESVKLENNATLDELDSLKDDFYDSTESSYNGCIPEEYEDNLKIIGIVHNIERLTAKSKWLKNDYNHSKDEMDKIDLRLKELSEALKEIETESADLIRRFELKYLRFIQEASWTSEDYVDNNLYFLDAETTLHKSAYPKVSYNFNVIDLSPLEEYKDYSFDIGDISYVEDTEFFGWTIKNNIKTPRREEVVITEQKISLDDPTKNSFKAQNYRTTFESLFQKLAASTQQLQFHEGEFQRAADVIDSNGNISPSCLQDAFSNNAYILSNAANQTVKWDEFGITTTDEKNPAEIVRITSGGIFLTEDGGEKWTTGVTARGINASHITTGNLDTGKINIFDGSQKSFAWDSQGLNAYRKRDNGGYNINEFVRFNRLGIYGIGEAPSEGSEEKAKIDKIKQTASFYLGRDGLHLNKGTITWSANGTSGIKAPGIEDIDGLKDTLGIDTNTTQIGDKYVISPYISGGYLNIGFDKNRVFIDPAGIAGVNPDWGKVFGVVTNNELVIGLTKEGGAYFKGEIQAGAGKIGGFEIGSHFIKTLNGKPGDQNFVGLYNSFATTDAPEGSGGYVTIGGTNGGTWRLVIGKNFGVLSDGTLCATGAQISGNITTNSIDVVDSSNRRVLYGGEGHAEIGGFYVDYDSISYGGFNVYDKIAAKIYLCRGTQNPYKVCGQEVTGLVLGSGQNFGVTENGILYAQNAILKGKLVASDLDLSGTRPLDSLEPLHIGRFSSVTEPRTMTITNLGNTFYATLNKAYTTQTTILSSAEFVDDEGKLDYVTLTFTFPANQTTTSYTPEINGYVTSYNTIVVAPDVEIGAIGVYGSILPYSKAAPGYKYLGTSDHRWQKLYCVDSVSTNSDERLKDCTNISKNHEQLFDSLNPILFKWKKDSDKLHFGFGAQTVQQGFEEAGLISSNYDVVDESGDYLGLNYSEFIALNTWQIQKLKARVAELENKLNSINAQAGE